MTPMLDTRSTKSTDALADFRFLNFSDLVDRPVCAGKIGDRIGRVDDIVFALAEPYPEAVGIFLEFGWGKPTQFVPWNRVVRIEDDAVFVKPNEGGAPFPPFVDQPGWVLVEKHLMGRTILDIDGRQIEAVNDVQLVESRGRMVLVHVDVSFNGFLRRWGLGKLKLFKERLIGWKYVQPLNVEDAVQTDKVSLSVTRKQLLDLPGEDLADALEELSGPEQEALFSALDSEKAAEALLEAEPRAQRQIIAGMRTERARTVLSEMSVAQLADLLSVLPHDHVEDLLDLLPAKTAERLRDIRSEREATADALMSSDFVSASRDRLVGDVLAELRQSGRESHTISYVYVVDGEENTLVGVVDLRELVLAADGTTLGDAMVSPVISAQDDDLRDDLQEIFAKYHYRLLPVTNRSDHLLGVIRYNDIMKGVVARARS
jgi:CBS domain-containing protein/sporulation protein YlmC with PRC-barrel domain